MTLTGALVSLARACYRATPSRGVRKLAFDTFARAVRHRRTVRTVGDVRFDLDLGETIDLSLFLGQYEPEVAAAIRRYTRRGATVFDIGANIGAHTLSFAALVGRDGRVIAFEPTDYGFEKLARNLALNDFPQVEAVKVALSDRRSELQDVNFRSSWLTDGGRKDGWSSVRFETLDTWCDERQVGAVDLMKLDVDGNEFPLIAGARQTISRWRPILLMEAVGLHFDDQERDPYRILAELDYHFRDLKTGLPITIEAMRDRLPRNDVAMKASMNVLAMPAERKAPE